MLMLAFVFATAFAQNRYKVISNALLNVRETASSEAHILGTLESGSLVDVVSIKKEWAKVKYKDAYGFVLKQYIEQVPNGITEKDSLSLLATEYPAVVDNSMLLSSDMDFESLREFGVIEITYAAGSFEDVKLSGSYGISGTILPWRIAPKLYAGVHFSPFNFNFGLSDFISDEIRLGPAIGYYFTPKIFISMPLDVLCAVYFDDNDDTKTSWGMALAPSLYIGNKWGVFLGPQFSIGFSGNSKVSCGFRAGFYF